MNAITVGARLGLGGIPTKNDNAVSDQNSKVLDNVTCRESPIDTKNRLAAEV
jgi:hypothetical protein